MRTYTVHEPPVSAGDRLERAERLLFVREGFSLIAALLTPFWMLANRLWLPFLAYLGALASIEIAGWLFAIPQSSTAWVLVALHVLVGLESDAIRRWGLARRGYHAIGSVTGRTFDECERRFFEAWLEKQPFVTPAALTGQTGSYASNRGQPSGGRLSAAALWPRSS